MRSTNTPLTQRAVVNKVLWRLMPFIGLLYFISFIDRIAISFAGPHGMTADLNMTATVFGLASGIFFAGYILLEVPSNMRVTPKALVQLLQVTYPPVILIAAL